MKLFLKNCAGLLLEIPTHIVYMFRYWEYVDWRIQTAFYVIVIMLMVGVLAVASGQW